MGRRHDDEVDVDVLEATSWRQEMAQWGRNVTRNFGALARQTGAGPGMAVFAHGGPHEALCDKTGCRPGSRVAEIVKHVENPSAERCRNVWTRARRRRVAVD